MTSKVFGDQFTQLNGDVVTYLTKRLPNNQLAKFAQTNRTIYGLAKSLLLRRQYHQAASFECNNNEPLQLLQTLQVAPKVARYIRDIVYKGGLSEDKSQIAQDMGPLKLEEAESVRGLNVWLTKLGYLPAQTGIHFEELIEQDQLLKEVVVLGSILLCSKVQTLHLRGSVTAFQRFLSFTIRRIYAASTLRHIPTNNPTKVPFNKLRELELHSSRPIDDMETFSCIQLLHLMCIPSLLVLKVSNIKIEGTGLLPGQHAKHVPRPKTKYVVLLNCRVPRPVDIVFFMFMLPKMARISYSDACGFSAGGQSVVGGGMSEGGTEDERRQAYSRLLGEAMGMVRLRRRDWKMYNVRQTVRGGHGRVRWWIAVQRPGADMSWIG